MYIFNIFFLAEIGCPEMFPLHLRAVPCLLWPHGACRVKRANVARRAGWGSSRYKSVQNQTPLIPWITALCFFLLLALCSVWFSSTFFYPSFSPLCMFLSLKFFSFLFFCLSLPCPHPLFMNSFPPKECLSSNFSLAFHPALPHILSLLLIVLPSWTDTASREEELP